MSAETIRRNGWIASAVSLALWAVTTLYLAYHVFVVGLSADQRRAGAEFSQHPVETLTEPLFAMLFMTFALGVLAVLSLVYYGYAQWQYAHRKRVTLEDELENRDRL